MKMQIIFAVLKVGAIAQLVEHRTENPGVPGSIPGGTTLREPRDQRGFFIKGVCRCELAHRKADPFNGINRFTVSGVWFFQ